MCNEGRRKVKEGVWNLLYIEEINSTFSQIFDMMKKSKSQVTLLFIKMRENRRLIYFCFYQ